MVHILRLNGDQTNRVLQNNRLSLRFLLNIHKVRKKKMRAGEFLSYHAFYIKKKFHTTGQNANI